MIRKPLRIGIGGPVGSGKTALVDALCKTMRERYRLGVITNDIFTREDMEFLVRSEALPSDRIIGVQTGVTSGAYGAYVLQNLSVHDNIVTQSQGTSGIDESVGSDAVFSRNNVWSHNTYYLAGNAQPFLWHYSGLSASGWQAVPQDATGSFQ